ncbi:hypothetical protein MTO96_021264 [Rhipicephalus appendiculatus]
MRRQASPSRIVYRRLRHSLPAPPATTEKTAPSAAGKAFLGSPGKSHGASRAVTVRRPPNYGRQCAPLLRPRGPPPLDRRAPEDSPPTLRGVGRVGQDRPVAAHNDEGKLNTPRNGDDTRAATPTRFLRRPKEALWLVRATSALFPRALCCDCEVLRAPNPLFHAK